MDTLREKQEYFNYGAKRPFRFKTAPMLNPELRAAMKSERLDRAYRFTWGGVAIVREEPNSETFTIARGDRTACKAVNGVFMPKYIFTRAKQARGLFYFDDLNRKVCVTRPELVPVGRVSRVDYRYVDLGMLYWFLEARADADTLIKSQVYNKRDRVPETSWLSIMRLETKQGRYYEPGMEMIQVLKQREWENNNESLTDVGRRMSEMQAKHRQEEEEAIEAAGAKDFDLLYGDVMRRYEKGTRYSVPNFIPPQLPSPFGFIK